MKRLERDDRLEVMDDIDLQTLRFPMRDGAEIVWAQVSVLALRERAIRDGLPENLTRREMFDRLRTACEEVASQMYASGHTAAAGPYKVVVIPNGRL